MKIFGYTIQKEKEKRELEYYTPMGTALNFPSFSYSGRSMSLSAVYRATEIISDSCALLPIKIKILNGTHKENADTHSLNTVFKNLPITKYNFIKLLIQSVILKGNGFAYIYRAEDGTVLNLRYLEPDQVQIHYDKIKGNLYYTCSYFNNTKIEPCNIIHLVKNSYDGVNGNSVISFASRTITTSDNTEESAKSFFENGCNLSGVLTVQGQLSKQQREDIRSAWNQAYTGNGSGLAILQGNMKYEAIQLSAADSQLIESRQYNVQDIARFFGISPVLLGDLSHTSYNTIEAIQNDFLLHTLQPYIIMLEEEFTRKLFKPSENNLQINFDETAILKVDKTAEANYYSTLLNNGVMCINEVRQNMGLSPIEGGDKHIIPYTDIKQNTLNDNGRETDSK